MKQNTWIPGILALTMFVALVVMALLVRPFGNATTSAMSLSISGTATPDSVQANQAPTMPAPDVMGQGTMNASNGAASMMPMVGAMAGTGMMNGSRMGQGMMGGGMMGGGMMNGGSMMGTTASISATMPVMGGGMMNGSMSGMMGGMSTTLTMTGTMSASDCPMMNGSMSATRPMTGTMLGPGMTSR